MEIKIVFVGQADKDLASLEEKSKENIEEWVDLSLIRLKDHSKSRGVTKDEANIKQEKDIIKYLDGRYLIISISPKGKDISSDQFKEIILENKERYGGKIIFIIGGELGLSETTLKKADINMSMSKLELEPAVSRVVLLKELEKVVNIISK